MTRANGGTVVKTGFYWNVRQWSLVPVSGREGTLPGGEEDRFVRVPTLGVLLLAPVMGGAFVFFLPFVGFALLLRELFRRSKLRLAAPAPPAKAARPDSARKAA